MRLRTRLFDRDLRYAGLLQLGPAGDLASVSITLVDNGIGTASITLPLSHEAWPLVADTGARIVVDVETSPGDTTATGAPIAPGTLIDRLSGMVETETARIEPGGVSATVTVLDDLALTRCLGWPLPGAALSAQTAETDVRTGPVGQVVLDLIRANLRDRLGLPLYVATPASPGPSVTLRCRMQPILDVVEAPLTTAHRSLRIRQWTPGEPLPPSLDPALQPAGSTTPTPTGPCVIAEVVTREVRPAIVWTPRTGIQSGQLGIGAPTGTRVVVGGRGEGTARQFAGVVDAALERAWGPLGVREVFTDARDAEPAELVARGTARLGELAASAGVSVRGVDGQPHLYGRDYGVGDVVRCQVAGLPLITDRVRSVTITDSPRQGLTVSPQIGEPTARTDPDAALDARVRRLTQQLATAGALR